MAGHRINSKGRGKDDKNKGNKHILQSDETEDPDYSLLRKPIQTSISGFGQARKIFDLATEELKTLLSDECDLLYECKVCRNLFRSLANFISHKRVYCKEKFNSTVHGHFIKSSSTLNELMKIKDIEEGYQESLKENGVAYTELEEQDERIPLTKDLTTIVEKLAKNKGVSGLSNDVQLALQKIPSSTVAMFQHVENGTDTHDSMRTQVNEIENIISRNVAVLQSDGNFKVQSDKNEETENVIQISDDEDYDTTELKCKKCDMQFSTQKTLKFHIKYKHVESRLVYPCPDCMEIFSTSWSVYRHLFKVHRKTAAQIRRMRESIQAKAFKMNNPPAFYEKRKNMKTPAPPKITEQERIDQENQAWMDKMEWMGGVARCGGCGRSFERRAALAAHAQTCAPRDRLRRPDKRIEIQIRKDYNKAPRAAAPASHPPQPPQTPEKSPEDPEKSPEQTKTPTKEVEESPPPQPTQQPPPPQPSHQPPPPQPSQQPPQQPPQEEEKVMNVDEVSMDSSLSRRTSTDTDSPEKSNHSRPEKETTKNISRLPYAEHAEKSNLMALRQRIIGDIVLDKLLCKKCDTQHDHIQDLYDHVAAHYKWMRYACKLCNFKHYHFDKLPEHVKVVHKLKGDKDFYFSTVKALDGTEALELSEPAEETSEVNETSPESRRPSRCSSDSSRLSDDSSSSNTRVETTTRKRKTVPNKGIGKRRRETGIKGKDDDMDKDEDYQVKGFEENSSDLDDVYEKTDKKAVEISTVASRRPVRRRTKPKNEDFEYDLSNLLKMEAQGYRDSQTVTTTKTTQTKKKTQQDNGINFELLNKECCGALVTLSRRSVEIAKAHMKTQAIPMFAIQKERLSNIFVRPLLPKTLSKGEKGSPKKDGAEIKDKQVNTSNSSISEVNTKTDAKKQTEAVLDICETVPSTSNTDNGPIVIEDKEQNEGKEKNKGKKDNINTKSNIPPVVPIKFRRQSLDVMKNPLINKNIKDFSKAGMKTKILVIKPINRNKDSAQTINTPLKFQTIKLKDTTLNSTEDNNSDQVVVVKMPKVDRNIARAISESAPTTNNSEKCSNENISENMDTNESESSAGVLEDKIKSVNGDLEITKVPCINIVKKDDTVHSKSVEESSSQNMEVDKQINSESTNSSNSSIDDVQFISTVSSTTD